MKNRKKSVKKELKKGRKENKKKSIRYAPKTMQNLQLVAIGLTIGLGVGLFPTQYKTKSGEVMLSTYTKPADTMENLSDFPISTTVTENSKYTLSFDHRTNTPNWVYEHFTAGNDVLESSDDNDYLTALSPRLYQATQSSWNALEENIYQASLDKKNTYVISGAAFAPDIYDDGNRYVVYRVIGEEDAAVPTHLYKVVLSEDFSGEYAMTAFLVPNDNYEVDLSFEECKMTVNDIEQLTGLTFFNTLDESVAMNLKMQ